MIKYFFIPFFLFVFFSIAYSQEKDFGLWLDAGVEAKIIKGLKAEFNQEVRLAENASRLDKTLTDIGVNYAFNRYFGMGVFYRFTASNDKTSGVIGIHRVYTDLSLKYKIHRFSFNWRSRFQTEDFESTAFEKKYPAWYNRNKFSCKYNIPKIPLNPFISYEAFYQVNKSLGNKFDKYRATLGIDYKLFTSHTISIWYMIQQEMNVTDPTTSYILGLEYSYEF